jgi:hypothetical protein
MFIIVFTKNFFVKNKNKLDVTNSKHCFFYLQFDWHWNIIKLIKVKTDQYFQYWKNQYFM